MLVPTISRQTIDEVRRRANLVEIAGRYTALKRAGREYRGLSPFAEEKTPSFFVNPEKNVFSCFSTQEAGDVFGFVQRMENLSFQEAVEHLAEKVGVPVEYEAGGPTPGEVSLRKRLFEANAQAASFFADRFQADDEAGRAIRRYWTEDRGFSASTATEAGIGFAPTDPEALSGFLRRKGIDDEALDGSGLFYERRHAGGRFFPRFRGRLVVPVRDVQGRVVGFTARVTPLLPEDDKTRDAKYVNSPETPLFQKRRIVFGLERAGKALRDGGRFLLVEGQLDVIRCWEAGIAETIALQGTAAGAEQFALLRRFATGVDVLLDGDRAGTAAAFKLISLGFEAGIELRFATLPEGEDPDDLVRRGGAGAVAPLRQAAESPIRFALRFLAPDPGRMDAAERAGVTEPLFDLLRSLDTEILREDYLEQSARYLRVDPQALRNDFERFRAGRRGVSRDSGDAPVVSDLRLTENEEVLLFLLLHSPETREKFSQISICEWITENSLGAKLLRRLASELAEGAFVSVEDFQDHCETDEERTFLARLLFRAEGVEDPLGVAAGTVRELVRGFASKEIARLVEEMNELPVGDPRLRELQARRRELRSLYREPPDLLEPS